MTAGLLRWLMQAQMPPSSLAWALLKCPPDLDPDLADAVVARFVQTCDLTALVRFGPRLTWVEGTWSMERRVAIAAELLLRTTATPRLIGAKSHARLVRVLHAHPRRQDQPPDILMETILAENGPEAAPALLAELTSMEPDAWVTACAKTVAAEAGPAAYLEACATLPSLRDERRIVESCLHADCGLQVLGIEMLSIAGTGRSAPFAALAALALDPRVARAAAALQARVGPAEPLSDTVGYLDRDLERRLAAGPSRSLADARRTLSRIARQSGWSNGRHLRVSDVDTPHRLASRAASSTLPYEERMWEACRLLAWAADSQVDVAIHVAAAGICLVSDLDKRVRQIGLHALFPDLRPLGSYGSATVHSELCAQPMTTLARAVIEARLERMEPTARETLHSAAPIEHPSWAQAWAARLDRCDPDERDALAERLRAFGPAAEPALLAQTWSHPDARYLVVRLMEQIGSRNALDWLSTVSGADARDAEAAIRRRFPRDLRDAGAVSIASTGHLTIAEKP